MNTFSGANISEYQRSLYRGPIAHLMVVNHFVQKTTMEQLVAGQRYSKLSLAYEGYISLLAEDDFPPGELAAKLGISKQLCSKSIKELVARGLVARRKNPDDSRSSLLSLTDDGRQLLRDSVEIAAGIYRQFVTQVGAERMQSLVGILETLRRGFHIELPGYNAPETVTACASRAGSTTWTLLLSKLNTHFRQTLLATLSDRGFAGLKPSFGQVLGMINREPRRIQYIASVTGVSKQAVAVLATDLESAGYITREQDPDDRRQVILRLSPLGANLLNASIAGVQSLEASIGNILSKEEYQLLDDTLTELYLQVAEHYDKANVLPAKMQQLSEHLLDELGVAAVRSLTRHLITVTRGPLQ